MAGAEERKKIAAHADSLYRLLLAGADFAAVARSSSEDLSTKNNGGLLPTITAGATLKASKIKYMLCAKEKSQPLSLRK